MKAAEEMQKIEEALAILKQRAMKIATVVERSLQALGALSTLNELYIVDDLAVIPLIDSVLENCK